MIGDGLGMLQGSAVLEVGRNPCGSERMAAGGVATVIKSQRAIGQNHVRTNLCKQATFCIVQLRDGCARDRTVLPLPALTLEPL
jgi:hypothetical protein